MGLEINNKTFVITGGLSGLGYAVKISLLQKGGKVVVADIANTDPGTFKADHKGNAIFIKTDVTNKEDAAQAMDFAIAEFGQIDGLINCAGIAPGEKIYGKKGVHRLESFSKAVSINLIGSFNMLRLAAEKMTLNKPGEDAERGVIINTASIAAYDGQIGQIAYAASKGGVCSMTLPAARELAEHGIRVMAIAPGIFETPMMSAMPDAVKTSLGEKVPFPARLGKPKEFSNLVETIITNRMLNGEVIRLDGSLRMAAK